MQSLEVLFSPAEFESLKHRDLGNSLCVVFDVLRATTTILTALNSGAEAVISVTGITEALAWRARRPDVLLAGERHGLRITARLTGGVDFDLGNSPREFTPERVQGRTIVTTTTNGTRALRAVLKAHRVLVGGFVNLSAVAALVAQSDADEVIVVCSGTGEEAAFEDTLAAGALCDLVWPRDEITTIADSAQVARELFLRHSTNLTDAMTLARNGRTLLAIPSLAADVPFCVQRDTLGFVAELCRDGSVRRIAGEAPSLLEK
ncbi:MAG TPA: 2-phosphosulfolactate phosphatase [Verrucomicrobiae bacterium]|jgi:2-phosphosulfolactate phosphatase